jgi:hypothetical protein
LDELVETMALFSQGSYSELLEIIAQETVQAYVEARLNVWFCIFYIMNSNNYLSSSF